MRFSDPGICSASLLQPRCLFFDRPTDRPTDVIMTAVGQQLAELASSALNGEKRSIFDAGRQLGSLL